ncbi:MAG: ATP-grasp domain-containing protein [Myxococcales bacterium]|nr:ATP-grasp domain-containing protein [Myxococcales bacterium]
MGHPSGPGHGIVVDAFSTGMKLAARLGAAGQPLLHVRSAAALPGFLTRSYDPAAFDAEVVHAGDLDATCARIAALTQGAPPRFIAVGTETGVALTDALAARYGLPGNDPATSAARRDKVTMAAHLERAGVAAPATFRAQSMDAALAWVAGHDRWPVVLKPAASAGNDKVFFCADLVEVRRAFAQIHGQENRLGLQDAAVVVQAYLAGRQYIVNTASLDGRHCVTDIWADHRLPLRGASNIYDYEDLLPSTGEVEDALTAYVGQALDALGVRHGPAHSEVMMTAAGPVLIETAARLQGGLLDAPLAMALDRTQMAMAEACYTDPARFVALAAAPYRRRAYLRCVDLIAHRGGVVKAVPGLELAGELPSFAGAVGWPAPGARVIPTVDLLSAPGIAYLCHPERDQIERDYHRIRALEAQGEFFIVEDPHAAS